MDGIYRKVTLINSNVSPYVSFSLQNDVEICEKDTYSTHGILAKPDNSLEFQNFSAALNSGTSACHAGGREFESRRPRH
jgi:hypothetical protein